MRERIIAIYQRGDGTADIAESPKTSESGTWHVRQHFLKRGTHSPRKGTVGRKSGLTLEMTKRLRELFAADCGATPEQLRK